MTAETMSAFYGLLTIAANVAVTGAIAIALLSRIWPYAARRGATFRAWIGPAALPLAWIVALVATTGSLYYSEVAHFVPCKLCWYQRIAMYPLSLLLGIAVVKRDIGIRRYATPLAVAGAVLSAYHYQLERFPGQAHVGCTVDASCTLVWVWRFHYISIPFMALSAFALVVVLLRWADSAEPKPEEPIERLGKNRQEVTA